MIIPNFLLIRQYDKSFNNPSFLWKIIYNKKSPSASAKGLEIDKLPLLDTFRTFKGNIAMENILLIS